MNRTSNLSNIFMGIIYEKTDKKFPHIFKYLKHKRKLKKFKKDIHEGSPSFGLLWKMSEFIKYAEDVFFYDNSVKPQSLHYGLYSSRNYQPGQNGFKINTEECTITIKLNSETNMVVLEIKRLRGEKRDTVMTFVNEQWECDPSIYDEMLLEQIIKIINDRVLKLFDFCYNTR